MDSDVVFELASYILQVSQVIICPLYPCVLYQLGDVSHRLLTDHFLIPVGSISLCPAVKRAADDQSVIIQWGYQLVGNVQSCRSVPENPGWPRSVVSSLALSLTSRCWKVEPVWRRLNSAPSQLWKPVTLDQPIKVPLQAPVTHPDRADWFSLIKYLLCRSFFVFLFFFSYLITL